MPESPYIYSVTEETFPFIVLEKSVKVPVLVDFWADWCGPCHMLMPILARLVDEFKGKFILAKVNSDEQQGLAIRYGVRSLPTVKVFKDGQIVDEFMGVIPESNIRALLEKHILRESDAVVEHAQSELAAGNKEAALAIMEQAIAEDPDNPRALIAYATMAAAAGNNEKARSLLDKLPIREHDNEAAKKLRAKLTFATAVETAPELVTLEKALRADEIDNSGRYQLAAYKVLEGDYENAMELLFTVMKQNPSFQDGAAKQAILDVFELEGEGDLVNRYRRQMFNLLH